jgi:hypothetical protein
MADKLGATLCKENQGTKYTYTKETTTANTYGWKLDITSPTGTKTCGDTGTPATSMTLGDPKYDTKDKIADAKKVTPTAENTLNILECKRDQTDDTTKKL